MEMITTLFKVILVLIVFSCSNDKSQVDACDEGKLKGYEVPYVFLSSFQGKDDLENEVVQKIKQYLNESNIEIDTYLVSYLGYPDTTFKCNLLYEDKYYLLIELVHLQSKYYIDSISEINKKIEAQHYGEELVPIIPPPTGNISGKDLIIYYYFEEDSVIKIFSQ